MTARTGKTGPTIADLMVRAGMVLLLGAAMIPAHAVAKTVTVGEGEDLTKAINGAECGDRVEITGASYSEDVQLYKQCPAGNRIHVIGTPAQRPLITARKTHALRHSGSSGFIIEHLEFTSDSKCTQDHRVIFGNGHDIDLVDLLVRDGGYDGIGTYCGAAGIRVIDSEVTRNGLGCIDAYGNLMNGDGIDLFGCRGCEVSGAFVHGNNMNGVSIKGGIADVRVHDSIIFSKSQYGLEIAEPGKTGICKDTTINGDRLTIDHNLIVMNRINAWAFEIHEVRDLVVEHNTLLVFDNTADIPENPEHVSGGFVLFGTNIAPPFSAKIKSNIFANFGLPLLSPLHNGVTLESLDFAHPALEMDHNLYYDVNDGLAQPPDLGEGSIVADPGFIAFPTNIGLAADSPAIDAGLDLGATFIGAAPDLGAFEYGTDGMVPDTSADPNPGSGKGGISGDGCGWWSLGLRRGDHDQAVAVGQHPVPGR